jgi:hypothetical protein
VGEVLLFFLEPNGGAGGSEGFAFAHTFAVAPVGVEFSLLFKHLNLSSRVSKGGQ